MATVSSNLSRAIRGGSMPTIPAPVVDKPMSGIFREGEDALPPSASDEAFSSIFAPDNNFDMGEVFSGEMTAMMDAPVGEYQHEEEPDLVARDLVAETVITPAVAPESTRVLSRAERFKSESSAAHVAAVPSAPAVQAAQEAPRPTRVLVPAPAPVPVAAQPAAEPRPWRQFATGPGESRQAITAKKSMAAAKVLTPLVSAVSFDPGSKGTSESKSKALASMLVAVHRCAVDTAEAISEGLHQDVPSWMVTQLMQTLSTSVADQWRRKGSLDVDALSANMTRLMRDQSGDMATLIMAASEDAYQEVTNPDIARFRISVSVANAAWTIYDWVTHERLSLDPAGEQPSRFFTYGLDVQDLVNKILVRSVDECRALTAQVDTADLRTAHLQSSITRMASLIGAEYVTQTRKIMNWISEPSIDDAEYQKRFDNSRQTLEKIVFPQIFEYARVSFLSIENSAFRAIEDLHEKNRAQNGSVDGTRPATS